MEKMHFIVGDRVKFTLTPIATLHKGNHFVGEVVSIIPKIFKMKIKPSSTSAVKLSRMLNGDGTITLEFRCCHIYNEKAALELREKIEKERALKAAMVKNPNSFYNKVRPAPKQERKPKKEKKGWSYSGKLG
jgi:hypothetical protein